MEWLLDETLRQFYSFQPSGVTMEDLLEAIHGYYSLPDVTEKDVVASLNRLNYFIPEHRSTVDGR